MIVCLLALTYCANANAQTQPTTNTEPPPRVIETLDNGRGYVVEINGVQFRAVGAERWRELLAKEIKADASAELDKLVNEQKGQLINYIAALEKRADLDQRQIEALTKLVSECQRKPTGKGVFLQQVAGAAWQVFLWYRAVR